MDILKTIKKVNPVFDINKYNPKIFNDKTIKLFGLEILVKYVDYIDEKVSEISISNPTRFQSVYNENFILFCKNINVNPREIFLNNLLSDDMLSAINIYEIYKENYQKKFYEFLIKNKCQTDRDFNLIDFYKKNRNLINKLDLNNKKILDKLNLYYRLFTTLQSYQIDFKIEKEIELDNIKMIIKCIVKNFILNNSVFNSMNLITEIYFDLDINNFCVKIKDIYKIKYMFSNSNQKSINDLYELKSIIDSNKLLEWFLKFENELYFFEDIIKKAREISSKDIIKCLTPIMSRKETIILDGKPFVFLVHKLSGYNNSYISKKINEDISAWDNCDAKDLVLSTSLIDQYYLGMVADDVPILGFYNLGYTDIIDTGINDLYSNYSMYKKGAINPLSRYMLSYDFMLNSTNSYNEIVVKRDKNGITIKPDYLVSLDYITSQDKIISAYFNIPIYNIKTKLYIDKMIEHLNYLLETEQYELYLIFFHKMYSSFVLNLNMIKEYVNIDNLSNILDKLLLKIDRSTLTKEDIIILKNIANTFNFISDGQQLIGNKFIKTLNKKI